MIKHIKEFHYFTVEGKEYNELIEREQKKKDLINNIVNELKDKEEDDNKEDE
jgi:hypothetical protein